jgi:RNA polymerase sigma factor (sigma-70 family)
MNSNLIETPDDQLAAACARRGDPHARRLGEAAFRTLYDRHAKRLLAFLGGRVSMAVLDDVHQDVWAKAWQSLPAGYRGGNFRAWIHQIARNVVIDHLRKRRHEPLADDGELIDREQWDKAQKLERASARLADLVRSRAGGESYDAYCARTGMPAEKAYRAFHRAKAQLQACVEGTSP